MDTHNILQIVADAQHRELKSNPTGMTYLKTRGITEKSINELMIGYNPGFNFTLNTLKENNISLTDGINSGIIVEKDNNYFDYFSNFITFPLIYNVKIETITGRVASFSTDLKIKHLHLKHPIKHLYNIESIKDSNRAIIVESAINLCSLKEWGINDVVATLGTNRFNKSFAADFNNKLVFIVFDTDTNFSGQKATVKTAGILYEYTNAHPVIVDMPLGVDINDFAQNNTKKDFYAILNKGKRFKYHPAFEIWKKNKQEERKKNASYRKAKSSNSFDKVKGISIVAVIQDQLIDLQKQGGLYLCNCPLPDHNDTNASFVVYKGTNTVKCYGCGFYGNSISFIAKYRGISYSEAVNYLTKKYL